MMTHKKIFSNILGKQFFTLQLIFLGLYQTNKYYCCLNFIFLWFYKKEFWKIMKKKTKKNFGLKIFFCFSYALKMLLEYQKIFFSKFEKNILNIQHKKYHLVFNKNLSFNRIYVKFYLNVAYIYLSNILSFY